MKSDHLYGQGYLFLYSICISITSALIKTATESLKFPLILFVLFSVSFLTSLGFTYKEMFHLHSHKRLQLLVLRFVFWFIGLSLFLWSLAFIPLVNAITLRSTTPLFTTLFAFIFLKENTSKWKLALLGVGFLGVILILNPSVKNFFHFYDLLPLIAALILSISILYSRKLTDDVPTNLICFATFLFGTITGLLLISVTDSWSLIPKKLFLDLLTAGFLFYISQYSILEGLRKTSLHHALPYLYLNIPLSGFLGWLIWNELPSLTASIGILIVLVCALAMGFCSREKRSS